MRKYISISEVGMNVIAEGKADFVQNKIPVSQVGTNIDTVGYMRKYIPIYEVGMNVIAEVRADFVQKQTPISGV